MIPQTYYPVHVIFTDGEGMDLPTASRESAARIRDIMRARKDVLDAIVGDEMPVEGSSFALKLPKPENEGRIIS